MRRKARRSPADHAKASVHGNFTPRMKVTGSQAGPARASVRSALRCIRVRGSTSCVCALGACWALTGCADKQRAAAASPALPRAITAQEAKLLDRAKQILVSGCMRRHGFRFWVRPNGAAADVARFAYVVDDIRWASRHGYGNVIQRGDDSQRRDPNRRYFAKLSPARQQAALRALNGARPEGLEARLPSGAVARRSDRSCTSEAERRLYGDLQGWFRASTVTDNLFGARAGRVTADAGFVAATQRWSACMRAAGHRYVSPLQARAAVTQARLSFSAERRVAVAEATCAQTSGMSATVSRLDRHFRAVVNNEFRADVATARRLQLAALPVARTIARNGHSTSTPQIVSKAVQ